MRNSLIVNVIVVSMMAHGVVTAKELTITETFDTIAIAEYGMPSEHTIEADTVVENVDGTTSKVYYEHDVAGSKGKMMIKQYRLAVEPFISNNKLYTGSADIGSTTVSKFYQVGGFRYELDGLYNSIDIAFDYYNVTSSNGAVALVLQQVDDNGTVLWEKFFLMAGYASYISTWQSIHYTAERMDILAVQGREFNVVWVLGVGHTAIDPMGGQFDNLSIILNSPYEEVVVEEPPVVEEEVEEEVVPQPADECDCGSKCNKFAKQIRQARGKGHAYQAGKFERKQGRWCSKHHR